MGIMEGWFGGVPGKDFPRERNVPAKAKETVKTRADFETDDEYVAFLADQIDVLDILSMINFGGEASKKLADKAKQVRKSTQAETDLIAKFDELAKALQTGDTQRIKDIAEEYKLVVQKSGNWLKRSFNQLTGFTESNLRKKLERETQSVIDQIDTIVGDLDQIEKKLPEHIKRFQDLENEVINNQQEIHFHIKALDSVISKVQDQLIPELEAKIEKDEADERDKHNLRKLRNTSLARLEAAREAFISGDGVKEIVISQIESQRDVYVMLALRTREHLTHSRALWEIQGASAQGVVSTSRMITAVQSADELTPKMLEQAKSLNAISREDAEKLMLKSLTDPDALIEALEGIGAEFQETNRELSGQAGLFRERANNVQKALAHFKEQRDVVANPSLSKMSNDSVECNSKQVLASLPSLD